MSKICHEMVTSIRGGLANDRNNIPVLYTLQSHGVLNLNVDGSNSANVTSILEKAQWTPKLQYDVTTLYEGAGVRIAWLGHSRAGAVMQNAGLDRCTHFLFFALSPKPAHEIEPPTGVLPSGWDYCEAAEQNYGSVGSVASVPAFFSEKDTQKPDIVKIAIVPWQSGRWGRACRIAATFAGTITVSEAFCRMSVRDCDVIQTEAKALAEVLDGLPKSGQDTIHTVAPPSDALARLVPKTPGIDELPKFGQGVAFPYSRLKNIRLFGLRAGSQSALAVVGSGSFADWDWPGYLISIWGRSGDTLVPWAGFALRHDRGKDVSATIQER